MSSGRSLATLLRQVDQEVATLLRQVDQEVELFSGQVGQVREELEAMGLDVDNLHATVREEGSKRFRAFKNEFLASLSGRK